MNSQMEQHQSSNLETFSIKSWNRTLQWRHISQLALHDTPTVITDAPAVAHVADDQNLLLLVEPRSGGRSCLTHPSTPKSWIFTFQPLRSVHKPSVSSSFSSCTCCLAVMVASLVFGSRKSHWQIGELPRRVKVSQLIRSRRATLFIFPLVSSLFASKRVGDQWKKNPPIWYLGRNKWINRLDQGRAIICRVRWSLKSKYPAGPTVWCNTLICCRFTPLRFPRAASWRCSSLSALQVEHRGGRGFP